MFHAKEINSDIATSAWNKSHYASLFCSPELLDKLGYNARYFAGYKNKELLVVWPLVHTEKGFNKAPAFSYYFGPYWVENKFYNVPYKMYKNNLEVFNCLIPLVEKVAKKISFSLVPEFLDLRPFQWWNYHLNEGNKFNLNLRYTGRYHFKEEIHKECLIASFRTDDKRKKLRKILRDNTFKISWGVSKHPSFYTDLYKQTLMRSGGSFSNDEEKCLTALFELADKKMEHSVGLRVVELFDSCKSDVEGFQLLLVGKQNVYALAQCVTNKARKLSGNIFLTFNSLMFANQHRFMFDFNGANSPLRADDKHAFGAQISQYFDLELVTK